MKKITSLLALVLAVIMLVTACGGGTASVTTEPTQGTANTTNTTGTTGTTAATTSSTVLTKDTYPTGTTATTTTQTPPEPQGCPHAYTVKVLTQVTTAADGKIEKTCTLCGEKVEETLPAVKSLKVLAIGNSFSVDAMEHLAVVAKAAGIEEIVLGNMYVGGCSIDMHVAKANYNTVGTKDYEYHKNTGKEWVIKQNQYLTTGIKDEAWDIIIVQQVSDQSGKPETYAKLNQLLDIVDKHKTNENAKIYWHMTWAYQANSTHSGFANYGKNQTTMYNAIVSTVKSQVLGNKRITSLIPSGTAIQNLRTSYIGDTLTRDGYHLSNGIGRYTAALMWLKQLTGLDINNIEAIPAAYPEIAKHLPAAKEAVNAAYLNPFGVTQVNAEYKHNLPTVVTDTSITEALTDADKTFLTSQGLDPAKYAVLKMTPVVCAYYNSTSGTGIGLTTTANNSPQFWATNERFSTEQIPVGSVITIANGYQYRPEGWQNLTGKNTAARPGNVSTATVKVTGVWWEGYSYRAFNVSKKSGANVSASDTSALRIYVPIA